MTPLRTARLGARTERGVVLALGGGRTGRISLLGPSLVRVLHLRDGAAGADVDGAGAC